jgi:hypothetical protein
MPRTEANTQSERQIKLERNNQITRLVSKIYKAIGFPWTQIFNEDTTAPEIITDEILLQMTNLLADLNPPYLNYDELNKVETFLRALIQEECQRKNRKLVQEVGKKNVIYSKLFNLHLSSYLEQVLYVLGRAEEETSWQSLGCFSESDSILQDAVRNPVDTKLKTRYRVVAAETKPQSNEMIYSLQSRAMTFQDWQHLSIEIVNKRAQNMLYFIIHGSFAGPDASWTAVYAAIESGIFKDVLGNTYSIDWSDDDALRALDSKYNEFTTMSAQGHAEWKLDSSTE